MKTEDPAAAADKAEIAGNRLCQVKFAKARVHPGLFHRNLSQSLRNFANTAPVALPNLVGGGNAWLRSRERRLRHLR